MKVICDKRNCCEESELCGGSKPHEFDESECNKCPRKKTARCVPYKENEVVKNTKE